MNTQAHTTPGAVTVIRPAGRLASLGLGELWEYRELLYFLTWRDVKVRYKQTAIGFLWALVQPFLKMVVFSLVFGKLAGVDSQGFPYPVFVFAGLLPWQFFAASVTRSGDSGVAGASLVRKVYFPRIVIPVASTGACLVDFAISFLILAGLAAFYRTVPGPGLLMLAPLVLLTVAAALGVGLLISALNVAYRDFKYVLPFMVQIWMFLTPVIYPTRLVPSGWRWLLMLNPMTGIVDGYRSAILGIPFDWTGLAVSAGISLGFLAAGLVYFRSTERWFADVV
jgi:lipopolysaccharide transport system permease protein